MSLRAEQAEVAAERINPAQTAWEDGYCRNFVFGMDVLATVIDALFLARQHPDPRTAYLTYLQARARRVTRRHATPRSRESSAGCRKRRGFHLG